MTGLGLAVSSSCPIASNAAALVLQDGGTAFDASIALTACLFATLPMCGGLGGDVSYTGFHARKSQAFSHTSFGRAPLNATSAWFRAHGHKEIPRYGLLSSTAPAGLGALMAFHAQYGSMPLDRLLEPAIQIAKGVTVDDQQSKWIANNISVIQRDEELKKVFAPNGDCLQIGGLLRQDGLAASLAMVGESPGSEDVLEGYNKALREFSNDNGGLFEYDDFFGLADVDESVENLSLGSSEIWVPGAPSQGPLVLQAVGLYARLAESEMPEWKKILLWREIFDTVYCSRKQWLEDPLYRGQGARPTIEQLAESIQGSSRHAGAQYQFSEGDTTQFVVGDRHGNAIAGIISISLGFGAGVMDSRTGTIWNNRLGRSSTLNDDSADCVRGGFRPVNTIHTYAVTNRDGLVCVGGTPGGDGQVQWNAVTLARHLIDDQPLDAAVESPRFTCFPGADLIEREMLPRIDLESGLGSEASILQNLGHKTVVKARVQGCQRILSKTKMGWSVACDGHDKGISIISLS